jgi:hypothetical protein
VISAVFVALLVVVGTVTALRVRRQERLAMASAVATGPAAGFAASTVPEPAHAFDRLPEHIQKELVEIGDILRTMGE